VSDADSGGAQSCPPESFRGNYGPAQREAGTAFYPNGTIPVIVIIYAESAQVLRGKGLATHRPLGQ
jgi:hypothetical protein